MRETPQSIRLSLLRRELNDALAEVAQLEKWSEGLVIETQRLQGIEAEVERLRALPSQGAWSEAARMLREADQARRKAEAEVERLEKLSNRYRLSVNAYDSDLKKAEAEVERLRAALKTAREYVPRQAVVTLELCDVALRGEGEK